jgi:DHA1 family bicyclomycin/chloramphenicol resistance-like MFS transporter
MRTALLGALIVALGPISLALYTPAMPTLVEASPPIRQRSN